MKFHLKREIGETALTESEWNTLLCQIEAVANSRPICELNNDPNDTTVLTPSHFLNMVPTLMVPDEDLDDYKTSYMTRQLVQRLFQTFWNRWRYEYLHQLQARRKWATHSMDIKIGEIVTLKDENLPPGKWELARVIKKHTGSDGHTRVVDVKTKNNTLTRAIAKIAPLPVREKEKVNELRTFNRKKNIQEKQPRTRILPALTALLAFIGV